MKAIYWDGREVTLDSSYPPPVPDQETAIVKVHLAGICSTDLQIFKGYMNFRGVPGHEFVGSVQHGPEKWLGKRVVGEMSGDVRVCPVSGFRILIWPPGVRLAGTAPRSTQRRTVFSSTRSRSAYSFTVQSAMITVLLRPARGAARPCPRASASPRSP